MTHVQNMTLSCIHLIGVGCNLFKAAGCHVVQNAVSESGSMAAFWLELGVRDMFFFQIYTPTNVTSRQAPKNCPLTSMRILLPPTWRKRHGWICCNDSCFLVWHINIWRLESWHLSNILGPYEQIHFSDWWAMVWKHLAKAWGIPRATK